MSVSRFEVMSLKDFASRGVNMSDFHDDELSYCGEREDRLAPRWLAKQLLAKMDPTFKQLAAAQMAILRNRDDRPCLYINSKKVEHVHVSLSCDRHFAAAYVFVDGAAGAST